MKKMLRNVIRTLIAGECRHVERRPLLGIAAFKVGHALHQLPAHSQRLLALLHH
jgi:hypothetical protein